MPVPDRDRDDFVVLPDKGPKVPRIQCHANGHFQVGLDPDDLVVKPNGFSIVGLPEPPQHPNGEERLIPPPPWPPSWWPSIAAQPDHFQIGVPTVPPPWEDEDEDDGHGGGNGDGNGNGPEGGSAEISAPVSAAPGDAPRPRAPARPAPRGKK